MTPHLFWADRIRLIIALLRGRVWVEDRGMTGWGQRVTLRTSEHVELVREGR